MDRDDLLAAIESGNLGIEQLPSVFDGDMRISEDLKLRALAAMLRREPLKTGPFFSRLDPDLLARVINAGKLDPPLLSLAVRIFPDSERIAEAALSQPTTPSPALLLLGERVKGATLTRLLRDELRLVLSPELARALARNPNLKRDQWTRLETLLQRMEEDEQLKIRRGYNPDELGAEDKELLLLEPEDGGEEQQQRPARRENIYTKLMHMTAAEKAMLAIRGNREVRMLLVRDPNQLVGKAVMRSPRLNEEEVEVIARMREVDEEILRLIAATPRYMRRYAIIKNLVLNPRTPAGIAMNNIKRLSNRDIRLACRDHNLPSTVRQAAIRIARQRGLR